MRLRLLNLVLLRQLWVRQETIRCLVTRTASESSPDSSSSSSSDTSSSQETFSTSLRTSFSQDVSSDDTCDLPCPTGANLEDQRLSSGSDSLGSQETQALKSILDQRSNQSKRVTFYQESLVPDKNWRLKPYLGYDWIAGTLDNSSCVSSQSDTFFSSLQQFREAHQEECVSNDLESSFFNLRGSTDADENHECVYCYRVNQRLFLVPSDPDTSCRVCRVPRSQRSSKALAQPAQVRVSLPLSILDPPHQYHIHRRKSFDASDTLALPQHCLLGWDILPSKPERSSNLKSLDLWSSVPSEAQHRKLPAAQPSCLALPARLPSRTPTWSETQAPVLCANRTES